MTFCIKFFENKLFTIEKLLFDKTIRPTKYLIGIKTCKPQVQKYLIWLSTINISIYQTLQNNIYSFKCSNKPCKLDYEIYTTFL